jgi:Ser/Thr protein kinase RdoA (MazF antagonist)
MKLEEWLRSKYALDGSIETGLLRSYTNHVYVISSSNQRSILKIYGIKWRTREEIQYEVALLSHLAQKGLRVAKAIVGKDGEFVYEFPDAKGQQFAVMFEYAEGKKPQPPFSTDLYAAFGQTIGQMHQLADDFVTSYQRKPLDLHTLIDEPLSLALPLIQSEDDRHLLLTVAQAIRDMVQRLTEQGLDWGVVHGDATLDNLHVTDDGQIVLYDFDSGGPGWQAADLQGWAYNNIEYAEKWAAFKQGYASVRELKAPDLEAARYLSVAWLIWGLQIDLGQRILAQSDNKIAAYLRTQIDAIRAQTEFAFR